MFENQSKAYIVAVDMGYGHQRAVFPLEFLATIPAGWGILSSNIISANSYPGIPESDKNSWDSTRKLYERVSRMRKLPIIGNFIFGIMDYVQRIEPFYPRRDLSKPTIQVKQIYRMIRAGLGKDLIVKLNENSLPLLTSFFIPALFAEEHGYKGKIYCLCTDTDISRAWVPLNPATSKIIYLAPTVRVKKRLELYGIKPENIITTGFPLPKELLGEEGSLLIAKQAICRRLKRLDPNKIFKSKYKALVSEYLESEKNINGPIALTFVIGGAGAQVEIGLEVIKTLSSSIKDNKISLNLVAGISEVVRDQFKKAVIDAGLTEELSQGKITIIYNKDKFEYFRKFTALLNETDVLWTKPSELSFYIGLGLPILIAPPLGSQEVFNKDWMLSIGGGIVQENPCFTQEWFWDLVNSGQLAEAAINGFIDAPKRGTFHIEKLLTSGKIEEIEEIHTL